MSAIAEIEFSHNLTDKDAHRKAWSTESGWARFVASRTDEWWAITGLPAPTHFEFEVPMFYAALYASRAHSHGRIDIVARNDTDLYFIETKTVCSLSKMMEGIGQLLAYREMSLQLWGKTPKALILAAPKWPSFLVETVERNKLDIYLTKLGPSGFYCRRGVPM